MGSPNAVPLPPRPTAESAYAEVVGAMREAEELVAQAVLNAAATLHRR